MRSCLLINIADLLHQRGVEAARIELKGSWNEGPTSQQVLHTICAFANDFHNLNGGYVVIGVEEQDGVAVLPPRGLEPGRIEAIQKSIRAQCKRLDPEYQPIQSPEVVDGRHILVLWASASEIRPHSAPLSRQSKERRFFVRLGAETVQAQGRILNDLLSMAAKVPFDVRQARGFTLDDLRATLVREFLRDVNSALLDEADDLMVYRQMQISVRVNDHEIPRNVALLFFSDDPDRIFPGARIEVVHFANDGDVFEEHIFRGPLHRQVRDCLSFLRGRAAEHIHKVPDRAETENWLDYPFAALEEAIVNAVYHRGYEAMPEPTKVYVYGDRIEITSYPGPMPGLRPEHFLPGRELPAVTARNRRIGEFLKELKMAEARGTGVKKIHSAMKKNGSPPPRFDFDEERGYFTVALPIHPEALPRPSESPLPGRSEGLILIAIGAESIRPVVEKSLASLNLAQAKVLVDFTVSEYVEADPLSWEAGAKKVRNLLKDAIEEPTTERLHLFYRGPVAIAPLVGAVIASSTKPLLVYHYQEGHYVPAYTMDRRFLIAKD